MFDAGAANRKQCSIDLIESLVGELLGDDRVYGRGGDVVSPVTIGVVHPPAGLAGDRGLHPHALHPAILEGATPVRLAADGAGVMAIDPVEGGATHQ